MNAVQVGQSFSSVATRRRRLSYAACCLFLCAYLSACSQAWFLSGHEKSHRTHLIFVHYSFPELHYGSDLRLLELMRVARKRGHRISFLCPTRGNKKNLDALEAMIGSAWHVTQSRWLTRWHPLVRKCVSEKIPVAIFIPIWFWEGSRANIYEQYGPVLRKFLPDATLVAVSDDCHSKREELLGTILRPDERPEFYTSTMPSPKWFREKEQDIFCSADVVTFISTADAKACSALVPSNVTLALLRTSPRQDVTSPEHELHDGLVFLGNGLNPTNAAAIRQFLLHVWPQFRMQMPYMRLFLVGQDSKAGVPCAQHGQLCGWTWRTSFFGLEAENNIVITSYVPSLGELLRGRLAMIVPIAVTTGVNTKLFEAFKLGLPVITTKLPLQALELEGSNCCSICDSHDATCWLDAVLQLQNEMAWNAASGASLRAGHHLFVTASEKHDLARLLDTLDLKALL